MKKLMTIVLVLCIGAFSGHAFGQQPNAQKNEKKGGFAVGGYDEAKPSKEVKRSIDINEEVEAPQKAEEALPSPPAAPAQVLPSPVNENTNKVKEKDAQGNAYGTDKQEPAIKESGQSGSQDTKAKKKSKNASKSKEKQK
jgi:hypothetical protein